MKKFMDKDFMLQSKTAKTLYHDYASKMPIYDYHCHLSPKEIWEDKHFKNITEAWLGGDHYKWRAMRSNGIEEKYVTGNGTDREKFSAYVSTLQYAPGNPLYHWTHLELQRYFDIDKPLTPKTEEEIWKKANEIISGEDFSARSLINRSNVKVICTTDDPIDNLEYHIKIKQEGIMDCKVLPTFRPDQAINIQKASFSEYINKLGMTVGKKIDSYEMLLNALRDRLEFFHQNGCRLSDHAMEYCPYVHTSKELAQAAFERAMKGEQLDQKQEMEYKTHILQFLGVLYAKHDWVMQIHLGAMRDNNTKMHSRMGADIGFDSIHDQQIAYQLSRFMDSLEQRDALPKTILYTLNPKDNYVLGTMLGNFQGGGVPGKIQFGSGWWFNDQRDGMVEQMKALANLGLLGRFVGMLTDSRSFLSYARHEYFRRILCNLIGEWVENGELPDDIEWLGKIVQDISYHNAVNYFKL